MAIARRQFLTGLTGAAVALAQQPAAPHLGSLHDTVQAVADASPLELSFLRPEFRDLRQWQQTARAKLIDLLHYHPPRVPFDAQVIGRKERDGFIEERITFRTTPQYRVPAHVLIPSGRKTPMPAVVVLHDHGGFYIWGREKVIAVDDEHPVLTAFKKQYYDGKSIANELVRQGYVVLVIDAFYWGERRFQLPSDPPEWRERTKELTGQQISDFNRRSQQNEQLVARGVITAGATFPGILLTDDMRSVDYLVSRPEVDRNRIGCVGLSMGGYRSFMLSVLEPRIKVGVDCGWMSMFARQIERHVINTMGLTFMIPGMYRYFDMPDLAALVAPRALMVIMGSRDGLFPLEAMKGAFTKIERCYQKAGAPQRQRCLMFDTPHQFNSEMQAQAWEWIAKNI
jgi:dienelactone hydrolase